MAKTLRFWNGHRGRHSLYVAAYSVAEACRLLSDTEGCSFNRNYFVSYWSEAWGTSMQAEVGRPTEPCVWMQPSGERVIKRLYPAPEIVIELSGSNPLQPAPSLCIKLAKLVSPTHVLWHDAEVQNWLRQMKNLGHLA